MKKYFASLLLALLSVALLAARPAAAAILFMGGEDSGFTATAALSGSGYSTNGSAGTFRSSFARESLITFNNSATLDPPPNRWQSTPFTASSNIWIHTEIEFSSYATTNEEGLIVRSPDGVARILLRQTATNGLFKISTRNAAGTITDLATASSAATPQVLTAIDLNVNYTCSGAGGVQLYINGVSVINYSGNPCTDAATTLNQIDLAALSGGNNGSNFSYWCYLAAVNNTCWSEIIVADTDTRSMSLYTMAPAAAGNTQSWTPNTLGDINEATLNDATPISTGSANALSEWTVTNTLPPGVWAVRAVGQDARVQVGTTGPQHFEWITRTAGSDFLTGSVAPTTAFSNFTGIWATNPNTGVAWTTGDITAAAFNLGIESLN